MPITVTISAETPKELRELLAGFSQSVSEMNLTNTSASVSASTSKKETKPKKEAAAPEQVQHDEPNPDKVAEEVALEATEGQGEPAYVPTVVELRAKAQEVGKKDGGREAIKALLNKFECKSISDVPDGVRAAFLEDLEAL